MTLKVHNGDFNTHWLTIWNEDNILNHRFNDFDEVVGLLFQSIQKVKYRKGIKFNVL